MSLFIVDDVEKQIDYATFLIGTSRWKEADALFEKLMATHPNHARLFYELGKVKLHMSEFDAAFHYLSQSLQFAPDHMVTLYLTGKAKYGANAYEETLTIMRRVLEAHPKHPSAKQYVIRCLVHLERWQEVDVLFDDPISIMSHEMQLLRILTWLKLQRHEPAITNYATLSESAKRKHRSIDMAIQQNLP